MSGFSAIFRSIMGGTSWGNWGGRARRE